MVIAMHPRLSPSRSSVPWRNRLGNWAGSLVLLPVCLWFAANRGTYTLLDNADLLLHEAGHLFLRPFGTYPMLAGGTLMQCFVPLLMAWHFRRNEYRFGVQVSLFWLGHNLVNISVYAADARAQALPLLGGDRVLHDWYTMLGRFGMLEQDQAIGFLFFGLGLLAFARAVLLPLTMRTEPDYLPEPQWPGVF